MEESKAQNRCCENLTKRLKSSSMRLYNSVTCTPVGTARRCVSNNWSPKSFLPEPTALTTQKQRNASSAPAHRSKSPAKKERLKAPKGAGSAISAIQTERIKNKHSPQSKNSDTTEATRLTAPVSGSFDSIQFDMHVLQSRSSASSCYSDPSLYAMSSSSTWTSSTSLLHRHYSKTKNGNVDQRTLSSSAAAYESPPSVVTTNQNASQICNPDGCHSPLEWNNLGWERRQRFFEGSSSHWRQPRVGKTKSRRHDLKSIDAIEESRRVEDTRKHFSARQTRSKAIAKAKSFQSSRRPSQTSSPSTGKEAVSADGYYLEGKDLMFPSNGDTWRWLQDFECESFDIQNESEEPREDILTTRVSPFTPIERPPPSQRMEVIAPFPCTPIGRSSVTSSSIGSDMSWTPYSLSRQLHSFGRSPAWKRDELQVPLFGGESDCLGFHSFPNDRSTVESLTSYEDCGLSASRMTWQFSGSSALPYIETYQNEDSKGCGDCDMLESCLLRSKFRRPTTNQRSPLLSRSVSSFRRIGPRRDVDTGNYPETVWEMLEQDNSNFRYTEASEREFFSRHQTEELRGLYLPSSKEVELSSIIDPTRVSECGKLLDNVNIDAIVNAIENFDVNAMTPDLMTGILPYIPTNDEKREIYELLATTVVNPKTKFEKFLMAMLTIRDVKSKLESMVFMKIFADCMESISNGASTVQRACSEIIKSIQFRKILGIILAVGNRLKGAAFDGKVPLKAVKVESLLKLGETKVFGRSVSVLEAIALVIVQHHPSLVPFLDDMPSLKNADELNWYSTLTEFEEFEVQLYQLRKLALGHTGNVANDDDNESVLTIPQEIEILRATPIGIFTLGACVRMAAVADEIEKAQSALAALTGYFGEDIWEPRPHELLRVIVEFCKRLDAVLQEQLQIQSNDESPAENVTLQPTESKGEIEDA